jgi:predicted enzyme related to lactoylglutathione lyase
VPRAAAVVYAKNLKRIAEFYQRVASLSLKRAAEDHVVLVSESFELVVVQIPRHLAESIEIEEPAVRRTQNPIKLVFFVENIAVAREVANTRSVALNAPDDEWVFEGNRVCDGHDPEGNVFQLRQIGNA